MNKKILIIGGIHGNEPLGIEIVRLLGQVPLEGVDALIANPAAVERNVRFIDKDLNRCFGQESSAMTEEIISRELERISPQYDLVLDFHNTQAPMNNCSFVGPNSELKLFSISSFLGLSRCIEATYNCINSSCQNVLSIEISLNSRKNSGLYWYEKIAQLVKLDLAVPAVKVESYRYLRRVTWQEKNEHNISNWKPFEPISEANKLKLGVNGIIAPIFIGSRLTEYYATLVSKERV